MYIRRKVFSKITTTKGEERYFSTTEFTRTYSNKTEECEEPKKRKKIAKKVAIGAGIAAGTTLAAAKGYQLLRENQLKKKGFYNINGLDKAGEKIQETAKKGVEKAKETAKKLIKKEGK